MKLVEIVQRLEKIAPLRFAGSWDNVGLLIDPGAPEKEINTLFVTNDLTENVMAEAMDKASNKGLMIVSYHPPIFRPLKRISADNWKVSKRRLLLLHSLTVINFIRPLLPGSNLHQMHHQHHSSVLATYRTGKV